MSKKILGIALFALLVLGSTAHAAIVLERPPTPKIQAPQSLADTASWLETILFWMSVFFWIIAMGFIFYAAFLYLTAAGEDETLKKAKQQLWYAVIAIAVALLATVIPTFIGNVLLGR